MTYKYLKRSLSFFSWIPLFLCIRWALNSANWLSALENLFEKTHPSRYPCRRLNRDTWSLRPRRRIFARTVFKTRLVRPYFSASGSKTFKNWSSAHFSSTKIAINVLWWFLFPGKSTLASSSRLSVRAILLWFISILVLTKKDHLNAFLLGCGTALLSVPSCVAQFALLRWPLLSGGVLYRNLIRPSRSWDRRSSRSRWISAWISNVFPGVLGRMLTQSLNHSFFSTQVF